MAVPDAFTNVDLATSFEQLAPITLLIAVLVLSWDILLAGWMASRREAPRAFTQLTSACGLLIAPALVIALASGTEDGARTVSGISWLLPVIASAFVLQVLYSIVAGLISPVVALPILLYDIAVTAIVTGDYLVAQHGSAPLPLQAAVAARDVVVGMTVGRAALVTPYAMLVPMITPAYPARWRLSAVVRALLVLSATAMTTLLVIEWPRGIGAVRSYGPAMSARMQARPNGDFALGMRFLPALDGAPNARSVKADRLLVDTFEPDILLVVLDDEGTRAAALDSLADVLAPLLEDSTKLAVALYQGRHPAPSTDAFRAQAIERVLTRLKPDVLFPAIGDPMPTVLPAETPPATWWRLMVRNANMVRERVRPATKLGIALTHLDTRDSAVYAWAAAGNTPVAVIGAIVFPSYSGLPGMDARLRAIDRWHANSLRLATDSVARRPTHWLLTIGGLPHAHGDAAQLAAMREALAWGSRRPWVTAAIIGEPSDYDSFTGVRAANGRIRMAWPALSTAAKAMRDLR